MGCSIPSSRFALLSPEVERELVYDDDDLATPIHVYLDGVTTHWLHQAGNGSPLPMTDELRDKIIEILAPHFDLFSTLRSRVTGVTEELVRLTAEQSDFFRGFEREDRLMVRGGAGTGKTLLALAETERLAGRGDTVMLMCANGALAKDFARVFEDQPQIRAVDAYALAAEIIAAASAGDRIPGGRAEDVLDRFLPEIACDAMPDAYRASCRTLIVDEAQDLTSPYWLAFLDALLDGGLDAGVWRFFFDPNQDLLLGTSHTSVDRLDQSADSHYQLTMNCRNTREIGVATAMLTGLETFDTLKITGPPVIEHRYATADHQRSLAASVIRDWINDGLAPSQITVLASVPLRQTAMAGLGQPELGAPLDDGSTAGSGEEAVRFSSVADFKGFEADAVLVVGIDDLHPGLRRLELYVAMSRARALLALLVSTSVTEQYDALAADFADRIRRGFVSLC